jgi:D-xylose transport system ATP-binding protein
MEQRARELLSTLGVNIPSVRVPVAALSGGQRQSVAIARSLLGEPRVVLLDEPTAALGVAQTAQVLDLIERLRDRGLGVILISHNLADVKAVADRVIVLRLGRNAGEFDMATATQEQIVQAITGASDNAVARRARAGAASTIGARTPGSASPPGEAEDGTARTEVEA